MTRFGHKPDPYIGWGIGLAFVLFVMYVYPGLLSPVPSRFDGSCRAVPMGASAEDVRIDGSTGIAYLSYYNRLRPADAKPEHGTVMLVDLNAAEPRPRAALASEPPNFAPSGMSLYLPPTGPKRLFVINRTSLGRHSVEIFEQSATGAFAHVESIRDRLLWSPNAIVAIGPRHFYVTNDYGFKESYEASDAEKYVQGRLRQNRGTVLYFDGERMKQMASRLGLPNGIAVSPDGRTVYVSEALRQRLRLFDRDVAAGTLKMREMVSLDSTPDNLTVDSNGDVWIGAHPRAVAFVRTLSDPTSRSPTQVLKFTPSAERDERVTEIYSNDGTELSAGTVAAPKGNLLVIGSIADKKLLLCTRTQQPVISGPEKET
jgi:arylesterase / paraoxonase